MRPIATKVIDIRHGNLKTYLGGIDYFLSKRAVSTLERDEKISFSEKVINQNPSNRKEKKRLEAELRQQKHKATKDLIKEISKKEKKIEALENELKNLENKLADPQVYTNGTVVKETTIRMNECKTELDSTLKEWEKLNEELQIIESQFS